jgi:hypothetical protein
VSQRNTFDQPFDIPAALRGIAAAVAVAMPGLTLG